jgi:hypothetical protein
MAAKQNLFADEREIASRKGREVRKGNESVRSADNFVRKFLQWVRADKLSALRVACAPLPMRPNKLKLERQLWLRRVASFPIFAGGFFLKQPNHFPVF